MHRSPVKSLDPHQAARNRRAAGEASRKNQRRAAVQTMRDSALGKPIDDAISVLLESIRTRHRGAHWIKSVEALSEAACDFDADRVIPQPFHVGIVQSLILALQDDHSSAQEKGCSLYCLSNLVSLSHEFAVLIGEHAKLIMTFLNTDNVLILANTFMLLGNIASDDPELRDGVVSLGIFGSNVLRISLRQENEAVSSSALWLICALVKGIDPNLDELFNSGLHNDILNLLRVQCQSDLTGDIPESFVELLWIASYLTARRTAYIKILLNGGLASLLLAILIRFQQSDPDIVIPCMRSIGNILGCCGKDEFAMFLDSKVISIIFEALSNLSRLASKEALWIVSNLVLKSDDAIAMIAQSGLIPAIALAFQQSPSFDVRFEAAFSLFHICKKPEYLPGVISSDNFAIMRSIISLIEIPDESAMMLGLDFVDLVMNTMGEAGIHLVEEHDGIEAIEAAREFNDVLFQRAESIMVRYFD